MVCGAGPLTSQSVDKTRNQPRRFKFQTLENVAKMTQEIEIS